MALVHLYQRDDEGWNVRHCHSFYRREHGDERSDTWMKQHLQHAGVVARAKARGAHRRWR